MNKHFISQDVRDAARMLSDYGIHTMGFLLLGGPGENKDSVEESLEFVDTLNLNTLKITLGIRIYPYSKLAKIAFEEGVIPEYDDLLFPRFYMAKGLENWLRETVEDRIGERQNWII
jgi:radical SAM superfamily enzyme